MIKTLLCCSLLVGGAKAMMVGPALYNSFDLNIIINLNSLRSEFVVPEQTTAENGPCCELREDQTICQELLEELEKKDSPEEDSKLLVMLKELEKKESRKPKSSEE